MDRAYKEDLPKYREALESLRSDFSAQASRTDWARLRIQPLLDHVESLHRLLKSPKFAREVSRLRKGVAMFHADLIYLRANIKALKQILADEKRRSGARKNKTA